MTGEEIETTFTAFFDRTNPYWSEDGQYNEIFLKTQRNYLNHQLSAKGFVFLNEALMILGLKRTSQGQRVGWIFNGRVGYINYTFETDPESEGRFKVSFEFDGPIWDRVDELERDNG